MWLQTMKPPRAGVEGGAEGWEKLLPLRAFPKAIKLEVSSLPRASSAPSLCSVLLPGPLSDLFILTWNDTWKRNINILDFPWKGKIIFHSQDCWLRMKTYVCSLVSDVLILFYNPSLERILPWHHSYHSLVHSSPFLHCWSPEELRDRWEAVVPTLSSFLRILAEGGCVLLMVITTFLG